MEVEGKALHMRKEVAAQLIDEALADSSHDVRVVIRKKAGQHRNYKCCDAGSIENLGTRKRGTVQPGADEWDTSRLARKHTVNHNLKRPWPEDREYSVQQHRDQGEE